MKYIFYILFLISSILSCKAQSPIVNIDVPRSNTVDGAYFKDLNNEFNKFVGTWIFTDGTNTLTIKLKKVEMVYNDKDYEDKLVGEYKYESNGFVIVNTLDNINNQNVAKHPISGSSIINIDQSIICDDCDIDERRIKLYFDDSERRYLTSYVILRYLNSEIDPEKMTATSYLHSSIPFPYEGAPGSPRVPYGTYLMEKQ
jgi:hypothetical protein